VLGAFLNVRINASGYNDKSYVSQVLEKGAAIEAAAINTEAAILQQVREKIG
jgi:glutamate formiminotransferase/formiminotetrahydrofolate cyclodeaminase